MDVTSSKQGRSWHSTLLPHSGCNTGALLYLAAAGGSVEPFWGLYQQHQKPEIRDILSKYRVGTLKGAPKASTAVPQVIHTHANCMGCQA